MEFSFFFFAHLTNSAFAQQSECITLQKRIVDLFHENEASVVRVFGACQGSNEEGDAETFLYIGTGFFISKEGHILTNASVTFGASRIWIEYQGVAYAAKFIGYDLVTNVALLQVLDMPKDFKFLHLSDTLEIPPIGTFLMGITCELGFDPGPSLGMISGVNTQYGETLLPTSYIRTDIPSDGGEGGSPIFDLQGRFVGMIIASLPEIRSSFILPARAALRIRDDILFAGYVSYAYIGVDIDEEKDRERGSIFVIKKVAKGSPAQEAGLEPGDIIIKMGDNAVKKIRDMHDAMFYARPGQYLTVSVLRNNEELQMMLLVTEQQQVLN